MGRQRNNLNYAVVGHIFSGNLVPQVWGPCAELSQILFLRIFVPAAQSQGGGPARVWRAGQDG